MKMKNWRRRLAAWALALVLTLAMTPGQGQAVLQGVYLTAVNENILELSSETMPFWSGGVLYVSNQVFEGTDLGISYVRNSSMGLAILYTPRTDLRFDLEGQTVYDKQGNTYNAYAIERGGYVFFPLDMVCRYFGLTWSSNETDTVPLIRIKSSSAALDDSSFLDAASGLLNSEYAAYEKLVASQQIDPPEEDTQIHAAEGQKVFLIVNSQSPEDTLAVLEKLDGEQVTVLLSLEQMENGDLLRALVAGGHGIALKAAGVSVGGVQAELEAARELLWQSACAWLHLVWYEGEADIGALLEETGFHQVTPGLDRRDTGVSSHTRARSLLSAIGRYREDLAVYLGGDSGCLTGMDTLLDGLRTAQYRVCAWRVEP